MRWVQDWQRRRWEQQRREGERVARIIAERATGAAGAAGAALPAAAAAQPRVHAAVQSWWEGLADIRASDFENLQLPVVVPVVALELSDVTNDDVISYSRFGVMTCAVLFMMLS